MQEFSDLSNGGIVALSLLIIYILIRDILKPLVTRKLSDNGGPHANKLSRMLDDLWHWHAPDPDGEQSWKGKNIERLMIQMNTLIAELVDESKRNNRVIEEFMQRSQGR
jgi:hypothetical protein